MHVTRVVNLAELEARKSRCDKLQGRPARTECREAEVFGLVLPYPNRSARLPKRKPADLLAALESENVALRDQAVDIALQIQALREEQFR